MPRLLWLLLLLSLQACAGSRVAEQLESSFAVPQESVAPSPAVAQSKPESDPVPEPDLEPDPEPDPEPIQPDVATQEPPPPSAELQRQPPAPYRIPIRLAGADPAAPAEAVTRALRDADVGFAAERIERVEP